MKLPYEVEEYCAHCGDYYTLTDSVAICPVCGNNIVACTACVIGDTFDLNCKGCVNGSKFELLNED